jgi:hypothetical protein
MKKNFSLYALLLLLILSTGCDWRRIRGNGHITTEARPVTGFTQVEAGGAYELEWRPGTPSLSLTTDQNLLEQIETSVSGNTLRIKMHDPLAPTHGIKIAISSPNLSGADLSGAVRFGAAQISGAEFILSTSGAARISLAGQATHFVASLTGASRLQAESLQTDSAEISVTGAGKADIAVANSLKVAITGAGRVTYTGDPKSVQKQITGAGKVERRR